MDSGGVLSPIPITEEDKAHLGVVRNQVLQKWKKIAIIGVIGSIITIGFGIAQLLMTSIGMHSFGGPVIVGVLTLILVFISLGAVYEGRKSPEGDQPGGCLKSWVMCYFMLSIFFVILCFVMMLFSLIGMLVCFIKKDDEDDNLNPCSAANGDSVKVVAVLAFLSAGFLTILNLVGVFFYCCNTRAFGFKSRNEIMLEYQMQTLTEAQRRQGQQMVLQQVPVGYQPQANTYQYQGYQPNPYGQSPYGQNSYGQDQGQMYATALPAGQEDPGFSVQEQTTGTNNDLPPTYKDVMM